MKCPRCSGRMLQDYDELSCLACGHRQDIVKESPRMDANVFEDAKKSLTYALEQARQQLTDYERGADTLREQVKTLEKAMQAFDGKTKRQSKGWSEEARAAQAERMRQRNLSKVSASA